MTVVADDNDDLNRIARELADLGLVVVDENLIRSERAVPFGRFSAAAGEEPTPDVDPVTDI